MNWVNTVADEQLFTLPEWTMRLEASSSVAGSGTYEAHVFRHGVAVRHSA